MKKPIALLIAVFACITGIYAQKSITFKVERLTPPDQLLKTEDYQTILEDLIRADKGMSRFPLNRPHTDPPFNIVAKSKIDGQMVSRGYHSFFEGMYAAYAEHRPFTLSPDMMWLLISQGFANHVNNNSEELRNLLVNFKDKNTLIVHNDAIRLDNPNSPWPDVFPEFSKQIATYTGKQLTDALTADFSTTTPVSKVASQITLMNAVKNYFNFMVITLGCGIPQITLEGTPQDWEHVLAKTEALRKYKLDWWVDEMEPLLKQFVKASNGHVDKGFWKEMFKYHSVGKCGSPTIIDGWIVKFFPYNKNGKRNGLKEVIGLDALPNEIVKVDLIYEYGDGLGNFTQTPLELWAGFVGLKQDDKTFGLRPEIGWMIRKKDVGVDPALVEKFRNEDGPDSFGGIMITAKALPPELYGLGTINRLNVYFTDKVQIPDSITKLKIGWFWIHGEITAEETERLRRLLPGTKLVINGTKF